MTLRENCLKENGNCGCPVQSAQGAQTNQDMRSFFFFYLDESACLDQITHARKPNMGTKPKTKFSQLNFHID